MIYQLLPNVKTDDADIIILPFSYEDTVSAKVGTKDAPRGILEATAQIEYYDEDLAWSPMKHIRVSVADEISKYKEVARTIREFELTTNKLLITLGGEHSITPMISEQVLDSNATIVFLDAHADLRSSYLGEKYSHATPAYHLLEQGHKLVMAGIRSMFEVEAKRIKEDKNITFFSDRSLQKQEIKEQFLQTLRNLEGDIYLSIDMDVFNPAFVPSVGTPQPGGMDWYDATDILEALFTNSKINVKGVDIVELIPEESTVSQTFAAKLLQKIISYWGVSKGFDKREESGSQMQVEYE
ncbi:MAG: agmatinase [Campylobacterota bacterium]|nr:agmatinase [Campylobacterota bacterium]